MGREQLQEREDLSLQQAQDAQQSQEAVQADHADSLMGQATAILRQSDPQIKAAQTHRVTKLWELLLARLLLVNPQRDQEEMTAKYGTTDITCVLHCC